MQDRLHSSGSDPERRQDFLDILAQKYPHVRAAFLYASVLKSTLPDENISIKIESYKADGTTVPTTWRLDQIQPGQGIASLLVPQMNLEKEIILQVSVVLEKKNDSITLPHPYISALRLAIDHINAHDFQKFDMFAEWEIPFNGEVVLAEGFPNDIFEESDRLKGGIPSILRSDKLALVFVPIINMLELDEESQKAFKIAKRVKTICSDIPNPAVIGELQALIRNSYLTEFHKTYLKNWLDEFIQYDYAKQAQSFSTLPSELFGIHFGYDYSFGIFDPERAAYFEAMKIFQFEEWINQQEKKGQDADILLPSDIYLEDWKNAFLEKYQKSYRQYIETAENQ